MDGIAIELPIFLLATFAGAFVAGLSKDIQRATFQPSRSWCLIVLALLFVSGVALLF